MPHQQGNLHPPFVVSSEVVRVTASSAVSVGNAVGVCVDVGNGVCVASTTLLGTAVKLIGGEDGDAVMPVADGWLRVAVDVKSAEDGFVGGAVVCTVEPHADRLIPAKKAALNLHTEPHHFILLAG